MLAENSILIEVLQGNCDSFSSKLAIQSTFLENLQKQMDAKDQLITRQEKALGKLDNLRHGQKLVKGYLFGRRSEKLHEPTEVPDLFGEGVTDEELAEAKEVFFKTGFARIEKDPIPPLL